MKFLHYSYIPIFTLSQILSMTVFLDTMNKIFNLELATALW